MTVYYVDSNSASEAAPYDTWAKAAHLLKTIESIPDAAGDTIYVSNNHAETTAGYVVYTWTGTLASPTRIICGDDTSGAPPTAGATTGTIASSGDTSVNPNNSSAYSYIYGLSFVSGSGVGSAQTMTTASGTGHFLFDNCINGFASTNSGSLIKLNSGTGSAATFNDCIFTFASTGQRLWANSGRATIDGGSVTGSAVTTLMTMGNSANCSISGMDLSACASTMSITDSASNDVVLSVRNCKLPSSWTGSINSGAPSGVSQFELVNCDSGDTNYRYQKKTAYGEINSETTIVRTGGASDGTTGLSWKMVTSAGAEWNHETLDSPEIVQWNETTGSEITATIEITHDSQGSGTDSDFTDQEVWMEVQYLGTDGFPLSLFINDSSGDYVSSAADQAASSETWVTTGGTPVKQKLSVSFTPEEKGFIHAVVKMAGASDTCYVDPLITIT